MKFENERTRLIEKLKAEGIIRSKSVENAMLKVKREFFVPEKYKHLAYVDTPLSIPGGVTISAPHIHAISLEELQLKRGEKFLEVGSGSGIFLAYAYEIVRKKGKVFGVEIIPETYSFARQNLKKSGYWGKVKLILGDGSLGLPEEAPFDKILISAAAPDFPPPLIKQLKVDGVILGMIGFPYGHQELVWAKKRKDGKLIRKNLGGVIFVKLIGKYGWKE